MDNLLQQTLNAEQAKWQVKTVSKLIQMIHDAPTVPAVELPCKIGDRVYFFNTNGSETVIETSTITKIHVHRRWIKFNTGIHSFYDFMIGETYFLNRREASQALQALKEDKIK